MDTKEEEMNETLENEAEEESKSDPEWIDAEEQDVTEASFEFEMYLSTDGKHTVHVKADTRKGRTQAIAYAMKNYDFILTRYGTKQGQAVKEYGNGKPKVSSTDCKHTNIKFAQSKTEANPGRWFQSCKDCGKFLGWKS